MSKKLMGHNVHSISEFYQELADYSKDIDKDSYGAGDFLNNFEKEMAKLTGFESALFLPSGVMAQLIAIKIYAEEKGNNTFICHESCHLTRHENDAYKHLANLEVKFIGEKDKVPLAQDLVKDVSSLVYELPMRHLGGDAPTWEQLDEIKKRINKV